MSRSEAVVEVLGALLWRDPRRARALIQALPRESASDQAIVAVLEASLAGRASPDLSAVQRLALATGDTVLIAAAYFPLAVHQPELDLARAEVAWRRVGEHLDDPLAQAVAALVGLTTAWRSEAHPAQTIADRLWERRDWTPLGAVAVEIQHLLCLTRGDAKEARSWIQRGFELLDDPLGPRAAYFWAAEARLACWAGEHERTLDAGARALALGGDRFAGVYWDLVRCCGDTHGALEGLAPLASGPRARVANRLRYAFALLQAGRAEDAGAALVGVVPRIRADEDVYRLLRAAVGDVPASDATPIVDAARRLMRVPDPDLAAVLGWAVDACADPDSAVATRLRCAQWEALRELGQPPTSTSPPRGPCSRAPSTCRTRSGGGATPRCLRRVTMQRERSRP